MDKDSKRKFFQPSFDEFRDIDAHEPVANGHRYPLPSEDNFLDGEWEEGFSLTEEYDHGILMHRDAHFGGDFSVMINYYSTQGIGVNPEFDFDRIVFLATAEEEYGQNLAPLILTGAEMEKVGRARKKYLQLKEIYNLSPEENTIPRLIADLILTEQEEPVQETENVILQGKKIIPELIKLIENDEFYDPLFPGYGLSPSLAIYALSQIGDPSTIVPIFESFNHEIIFEEEIILEALLALGAPAKTFLLNALKGRPITIDNENAAFALTAFLDDPEIAKACLQQLEDKSVYDWNMFVTYLLCNCTELTNETDRDRFKEIAQNPQIPSFIQEEMKKILSDW